MNQSLPENLMVYPRSAVEAHGTSYCLARDASGKVLCVAGDTGGFEGEDQATPPPLLEDQPPENEEFEDLPF